MPDPCRKRHCTMTQDKKCQVVNSHITHHARTTPTGSVRKLLPELLAPLPYRLVNDDHVVCREPLVDVTLAEVEAKIQRRRVGDDYLYRMTQDTCRYAATKWTMPGGRCNTDWAWWARKARQDAQLVTDLGTKGAPSSGYKRITRHHVGSTLHSTPGAPLIPRRSAGQARRA